MEISFREHWATSFTNIFGNNVVFVYRIVNKCIQRSINLGHVLTDRLLQNVWHTDKQRNPSLVIPKPQESWHVLTGWHLELILLQTCFISQILVCFYDHWKRKLNWKYKWYNFPSDKIVLDITELMHWLKVHQIVDHDLIFLCCLHKQTDIQASIGHPPVYP